MTLFFQKMCFNFTFCGHFPKRTDNIILTVFKILVSVHSHKKRYLDRLNILHYYI